jgi:phosphatidylglycerophosphatase A
MERFTGGWGVMLDDILAGIYGAVGILVVRLVVNSICGL